MVGNQYSSGVGEIGNLIRSICLNGGFGDLKKGAKKQIAKYFECGLPVGRRSEISFTLKNSYKKFLKIIARCK